MEQILVLFNPSLEIQTTDNYIDWTSLSVVELEQVNFSSRSIPVGTDSEIDVATMTFSSPIYLSAPVKVKRLGVITNIITSIFDESQGTIDLGVSGPIVNAFNDDKIGAVETPGKRLTASEVLDVDKIVTVNYQQYGVYVSGNSVQVIDKNVVGTVNWREILETEPGEYEPDISRLYVNKLDSDLEMTGTITLNELDETKLVINWDADSFPNDDVIAGRTSIDYIIDPTTVNPTDLKTTGLRILLLGSIGSSSNTDGPDAWKNADNTDFIANENDIIEWDGAKWNVVFDASATSTITHTTNLNTSVQYRWNGTDWLLSVDGDYAAGAWRLSLPG
jgi:hypothetical protein